MKGQYGIIPVFNVQTVISPLGPAQASGSGMLISAADVVNKAADSAQLSPMLEESEEMTGVRVPVALAYLGYHTAKNLEAGALASGGTCS